MGKKSRGHLSINSENMFPIIKKWLYSDHDIFLRELVSNGCDAITKLKKLALMGQTEIPEGEELKLTVRVTPSAKVLSVEDNGLGMTAEEVKEYINRIAFSGAADFLEKYKDKANEDQIIGHFGLGFYSSFMVADKVTIDTLSWEEGAEPVHWESEGGTTFTMEDGEKSTRGTTVTLYLSEDSVEFSNEYRVKEVLDKYCAFMPYPIYFENTEAKAEDKSPSPASDEAPSPASGGGQEPEAPEKDTRKTIYYVTDPVQQATYVEMFKAAGQDALLFSHAIDEPFISRLEMRYPDYKFCRIDSDVNEALTEELSEEEAKKREEGLGEIFKKALGRDKLNLKLARFKDAQVAAIMTYAEESRRMNDMFKLYGMDPSQFPSEETLVLNSENGLVKYLEEKPDDVTGSLIAQQLYDLALMAHKPLSAEQMTAFSARSLKIMEKMIGK